MTTDEIRAMNDMQKSIRELLGIVCGLYGVLCQLPGVEEVDAEKAVGIGNSLAPGAAVVYTQSTSSKVIQSIIQQAAAHQDEIAHKAQA